jgi:hypothetical protein
MKNLTPLTLSTSNFSPFGIMKSIPRAFNGKVIFLRALSTCLSCEYSHGLEASKNSVFVHAIDFFVLKIPYL